MFGTRQGVEEFCEVAHSLWLEQMFGKLLISGGYTGGLDKSEADVLADRLVQLGMPRSALILETAATNTGENVIFGKRKMSEAMDVAAIGSVLVIGKICSTRRYLMTLKRHWPEVEVSACPVNYFGVPRGRWSEHDEFRRRVLGEFARIPRYLQQGFISEIEEYATYPDLSCE
jgi:uncharacterized SAM-binding protein YcdF (DUF218 family)